jgi:hypothetical protein
MRYERLRKTFMGIPHSRCRGGLESAGVWPASCDGGDRLLAEALAKREQPL